MAYKDIEKRRKNEAERRKRNPEKFKANERRWLAKNPEYTKKKCAAFRIRNPDYAKKKCLEWRQKNAEKAKLYRAEWKRKNRARSTEYERRRKLARGSENLAAHYEFILSQATHCTYCGCLLAEKQVDHIQPLSRGGKHVKENLAVTCVTCNLTKNDKIMAEFCAIKGKLFFQRAIA